jgi:hypothetical protein
MKQSNITIAIGVLIFNCVLITNQVIGQTDSCATNIQFTVQASEHLLCSDMDSLAVLFIADSLRSEEQLVLKWQSSEMDSFTQVVTQDSTTFFFQSSGVWRVDSIVSIVEDTLVCPLPDTIDLFKKTVAVVKIDSSDFAIQSDTEQICPGTAVTFSSSYPIIDTLFTIYASDNSGNLVLFDNADQLDTNIVIAQFFSLAIDSIEGGGCFFEPTDAVTNTVTVDVYNKPFTDGFSETLVTVCGENSDQLPIETIHLGLENIQFCIDCTAIISNVTYPINNDSLRLPSEVGEYTLTALVNENGCFSDTLNAQLTIEAIDFDVDISILGTDSISLDEKMEDSIYTYHLDLEVYDSIYWFVNNEFRIQADSFLLDISTYDTSQTVVLDAVIFQSTCSTTISRMIELTAVSCDVPVRLSFAATDETTLTVCEETEQVDLVVSGMSLFHSYQYYINRRNGTGGFQPLNSIPARDTIFSIPLRDFVIGTAMLRIDSIFIENRCTYIGDSSNLLTLKIENQLAAPEITYLSGGNVLVVSNAYEESICYQWSQRTIGSDTWQPINNFGDEQAVFLNTEGVGNLSTHEFQVAIYLKSAGDCSSAEQNACTNTTMFPEEITQTDAVFKIPDQLQITPNPNDGRFSLSFAETILSSLQLSIYDAQGKKKHSIQLQKGQDNFELFLSHLPSGLYYLVLVNETGDNSSYALMIK